MVTKFSPVDVAKMCRTLAPGLASLPPNTDGAQLLWAITGNESNFGVNCPPRHEPAYDVGGDYSAAPEQAALLEKYGRDGACSYGPMQVMLVNAPVGYSPASFDDLEQAMWAGVYALNNLLRRFKPQRVAEVGYAYNGGHVANPNEAAKAYGTKLAARYLGAAMPRPDAG